MKDIKIFSLGIIFTLTVIAVVGITTAATIMNAGGNEIINLNTGTGTNNAATKGYVDTEGGEHIILGSDLTLDLSVHEPGTHFITTTSGTKTVTLPVPTQEDLGKTYYFIPSVQSDAVIKLEPISGLTSIVGPDQFGGTFSSQGLAIAKVTTIDFGGMVWATNSPN